ncbi:WG repeat-containing protein [Paenibacillus sp. Marseille-Q4541]|uniref:WG repeat-containing protein n=1 Tax=Paenibacillus sp. Marseille-Q4541 TaxID=2831522 RepID=UPI001BAE4C07|nr:WG repeat-containing protein [Paenibacillus sp. Marseille-Q4541]
MSGYGEAQLNQLIFSHLPEGAEIMKLEGPLPHQAIYIGDLSGDGIPEISVIYRIGEDLYLMVLSYVDNEWKIVLNTKGLGYGVTLMTGEPIMKENSINLVIGWQIGSIWSKLSVYKWEEGELINEAPADMSYSSIEIINMSGITKDSKTSQIALWIHDTGEAYRVNVLRWKEGKFVKAWDVYPNYFVNVVRYYERKTEEHPSYPFYWYYLADAQYHAGMLPDALQSINKNLSFQNPYPSRTELIMLKLKIENIYKQMDSEITKDRIIVEVEVESAPQRKRNVSLFPASEKTTDGTKWGYINEDSEFIISPIYSEARDFQQNGLAVVAEQQKYGLIDSSGRYVVDPIYSSLSSYIEHRAIVSDDEQKFAMIDEKGKVVTRQSYPFISNLHEKRAVYYEMKTNGTDNEVIQYGYLDPEGNEIIPAQYEEANDYNHQKALVKKKEDEYGLINETGEWLATYPYNDVGSYGEGFLVFKETATGKYGYMDEKGSVIVPPSFTLAFGFNHGLAIVNTSDEAQPRYGLINKQGTFVIAAEYSDIRDLGDKRWAIGISTDAEQPFGSSHYAIVEQTGNLLTEFMYDDVSDYKDGLASVNDKEQTYFIDRSGNQAKGYPIIEGSGTLTRKEENVIEVFIDQRPYYVNKMGEILWEPLKEIPLNETILVKEEKYKPNSRYLVYYPKIEGMTNEIAEQRVNIRLKQLAEVKRIPENQAKTETFSGDFDVTYYKKNLLNIELNGYHYPLGAAHGLPTKTHSLIHLGTGRIFMLRDLFKAGADYVKELSKWIGEIIKEDPAYSYVFPESYRGIKPDQPFYVTDHALHLYFAPYEIGPYAAGFPTFTIPFEEIKGLIHKDGEFWRSFHE